MTLLQTNIKSPQEIQVSIEKMMALNTRKQVFHAIVQIGGNTLECGPMAEELRGHEGYEGLCGLQRHAWKNVPGYKDRVSKHLHDLMAGNKEHETS